MFYRISGQFKTDYQGDQALFPVRQDLYLVLGIMVLAYAVLPAVTSEFGFRAILIPVLVFTMATMGLNILTGYAGQVSLGTAAFMGVGAYACYKLMTLFPELNLVVAILLSGVFSAGVGVLFGIPSLRIKGFYLAIATLAAQFFLEWLFQKWGWLYNYNTSGAIEVPTLTMFGITVTGASAAPVTQYYFVLVFVTVFALLMMNLNRSRYGRMWKAVRDFDIAAELIGINLMKAKLTAFAVSSYVVGVAGALMVFMWKGAAEANLFSIEMSFEILFIAIIGGLGSVLGNFLGALLMVGLPVLINLIPSITGIPIASADLQHVNMMVIGALIIFFLIAEPHGLARLWQVIREKLVLWPFPY